MRDSIQNYHRRAKQLSAPIRKEASKLFAIVWLTVVGMYVFQLIGAVCKLEIVAALGVYGISLFALLPLTCALMNIFVGVKRGEIGSGMLSAAWKQDIKARYWNYIGIWLIIYMMLVAVMLVILFPVLLGCIIVFALSGSGLDTESGMAVYMVVMFVTTFIAVIPVTILCFMYSMTTYIVKDHPEMSVFDALKESRMIMKGNKWHFCALYFSFIGWFMLCGLTLGMLYIWVGPYLVSAFACFYDDIRNKPESLQTQLDTTANTVDVDDAHLNVLVE